MWNAIERTSSKFYFRYFFLFTLISLLLLNITIVLLVRILWHITFIRLLFQLIILVLLGLLLLVLTITWVIIILLFILFPLHHLHDYIIVDKILLSLLFFSMNLQNFSTDGLSGLIDKTVFIKSINYSSFLKSTPRHTSCHEPITKTGNSSSLNPIYRHLIIPTFFKD